MINEKIKKILQHRGYTTDDDINKFLYPKIEYLQNPYLLKGMEESISTICNAIKENNKILIYGDYDVDGVTSTSLLFSFLQKIGAANITYSVANRFNEGYGIGKKAIEKAISDGVKLIITVDCGTKDIDSIDIARRAGVEVIVTDHHEPDNNNLPNANIILNPKLCKGNIFTELAGCGVVFKLIQGICAKMNIDFNEEILLLACIGTVCDIVPLVNENRIITSCGLKILEESSSCTILGLKSLIEILKLKKITVTDILFLIGPCINAAGRLDDATYAIDLLLTNEEEKAIKLATHIKNLNEERKMMCKNTVEEAYAMIEENKYTNVLYNPSWHQGILGIVASRCVEYNNRPSIILTEKEGFITGSARSNNSIDLYSALCECKDLLLRFGGHTMAAGISLEKKNLEKFKLKFEEIIKRMNGDNKTQNEIKEDLEISLEDIDDGLIEGLKLMQPFGIGNENPIFKSKLAVSEIQEYEHNYKVIAYNSTKQIPAIIKKKTTTNNNIREGKEYLCYYKIIIGQNNFYLSLLDIN